MDSLWNSLMGWFKEALVGGIMGRFEGMFENLDAEISGVAAQVGATPAGWNAGVFSMIKALSDTVVLPVAGIILTFVLCYELINLILERNHMHEFDSFKIFKWIFKTYVAVYILTNTYNIVMAVFELAQNAIAGSAGLISGSVDTKLALDTLRESLEAMEAFELFGLFLESFIVSLALKAMTICIFIISYGRMLEIYLAVSVAPIPFATMANHEWGQIGNNYLRSLFAVAFQGFLIMVCIGIYAVLLNSVALSPNAHIAIWTLLGYTALLCFSLFKTGSLSKNVFGAH